MKKISFVFFVLLLSFLFINPLSSSAQESWWKDKKFKTDEAKLKYSLCKRTFKDILSGFNYKNIRNIKNYFGSDVNLDIKSYERGYYSSNQAEIMLLDFMDFFTIVNMKYDKAYYLNNYSFAVGKYTYDRGSGKISLKVNIALRYVDDKWMVDQISIN